MPTRSYATRTEGQPTIMDSSVGLRNWPKARSGGNWTNTWQGDVLGDFKVGLASWHVSGFIDRYHRERRCDCDEFRGAGRRQPNRPGSRAETDPEHHSTVHSQSDANK